MDLLEIAKALNKNANYDIDIVVWDLVNENKTIFMERERLFAQNLELKSTINTLIEIIQALIHQQKGE